ncbi:MAG: hypothetical protein F4X84_02765 [Synechococcus sp. SB0662_bin_45]|nr:hypothetical protein [Cyanobacteria bacterium MAG IRC3_bin_20]MDE0648338.1 hypothetical protein [Cyanobacteria bacterium MAG IRC4_bin_6]MXW13126.1 hypothetical protein [Synechococcus sp. SB0668_bin_13]MXX09246.1 hypothetical protein [Synechococcus sp. SB0667_bin_8]MYE21305.1 hypothetical protein [Synechococcus sp. SB0662_bin_45]MYG64068.1 hypothetical protein [Synechococcus sp. SB0675_bin_7]MYI71373.1 hypothetical protein [Synechococcus sp. SB0673_bin_10]MYK85811.1 hypothetical protein [S
MSQNIRRQIIELVLKAATLAESIGIENLVQPGLVKEIIIADILGHELISSKRDADAHAFGNPNEKYEYLCCKEGGSFQFDRMFKEPKEKREKGMTMNLILVRETLENIKTCPFTSFPRFLASFSRKREFVSSANTSQLP